MPKNKPLKRSVRRSNSKPHSKPHSKSRSRSNSRSNSKSNSRSNSRSNSKSNSRSNSKSNSRSNSKPRSKPRSKTVDDTALLIIDMQYDFIPPTGTLAVTEGDNIIKKINKLRLAYKYVVFSQDWHPKKHVSFASTHNQPVFSEKIINGKKQMLWPDHCVQGTKGAKIHADIIKKKSDIIIKKGVNINVDSYSAFFDNDQKSETALDKKLKSLNIKNVDICGLALDYCVGYTALDAKALGYNTRVILKASRAVAHNTRVDMINKLKQKKITLI